MKFNKLLLTTVLAVSTVSFANANMSSNDISITPKIGVGFNSSTFTETGKRFTPVTDGYAMRDYKLEYNDKKLGALYLGADVDFLKFQDFTLGLDVGYVKSSATFNKLTFNSSTFQLGASVKFSHEAFKTQFGQAYLNGSLGFSKYSLEVGKNSVDYTNNGLYYKAGVGLAMDNNLDVNLSYTGNSLTKEFQNVESNPNNPLTKETLTVKNKAEQNLLILSLGYKFKL